METTRPAAVIAPPPNHPPPPAPPPAAAANVKKRPLEDITLLQNSPYYKMRAIVKDLRPHFSEVLRTPDFRNCNGAKEIREKMKIFMTHYKEMTSGGTNTDVSGDRVDQQDMKPPAEIKRVPGNISQSQQSLEGTYIVGGSNFGWNFVTFPVSKTEYYGRTKEAFREVNPKSE